MTEITYVWVLCYFVCNFQRFLHKIPFIFGGHENSRFSSEWVCGILMTVYKFDF